MDTFLNLQAFVAAADAGSFSAAGRRLRVVASVVSKRVDQLEWRIQGRLFERSTRKLTLTDLGERYLPRVRELVRQTEETLGGMAGSTGEIEGHIRVKVPSTLGTLYLSELLQGFLRSQPSVSLDVVLADRSVNPAEEGFDIAIGARPETYGGVQDYPLCLMRRRLCASPAYLRRHGAPAHPSDLHRHDCLVFATSGPHWEFHGPQGLVAAHVRPKLRTNDGAAILHAACRGAGIALLADYLAGPALARGELVQVLPGYGVPEIWLKALVPAGRADLPRVRMLLRWLQQHLAEPQAWSREVALQP